MKPRHLRILLAAPILAAGVGAAAAPAAEALTETVHAQMTPGRLTEPVTDEAGVLSPGEKSDIEAATRKVSEQKSRSVRIVFLSSFGQQTPQQWAEAAVRANGSNTAVLAISPAERSYALVGGEAWPSSEIDAMDKAAYQQLTQSNYAGAALAALDAATGGTGGAAWVAGGLGVAAVAGGGIWAASRRSTKKTTQQQLESARALEPTDTDSLGRLPTPTLEELAREALVNSDESIRRGKEELELATAEFGAERVRPFTSAMNTASTTLQRAFATHQRLYDAIPETEPEKRAMLVDIISSAGQANAALAARSKEFNEMRGTLMRADEEITKIVQRTVDARARIEPAAGTLADLRSRYSSEMLSSISQNIEVAADALDEAERILDQAREVAAQPAGRQGALVDLIAAASHAVEVSDTNLSSIEHAEANLRDAQANLPSLIEEIEGELREIDSLKTAREKGAQVDIAALDAISAEARSTLNAVADRAERDPLAVYTDLADLDSRIDAEIDRARGAAATQERALTVLNQQLQVAATQIQSAEDLINSRGRIISSQPRTLLAEAKRQFNEARSRATSDTRGAIDFARTATETARRAAAAADSDVREYNQRRNQSVAGDIATAVIWGSLLSGGGGGFGGGGFGGGGGGFSGGGGGDMTSRGGTF
ncbi:TPM domain-containing protein [Corynebacterium liangguodongii]|uniref:Chromosome partitioning protein ParA n=1 Tax=Corynebacterium liangguodongii TaxID=2079535 RepID=A0A2S0WF98_9CORY|nr:TPM domain-containing protein [Corynebacterium liangguodongii]AWB84455.1 chromosome partitioning protein ParA [Corynebacterium liangguodongii]PWB99944.1 TPM domain-containing protein [Corynebacterium liangguodongii]